MTTRKLWIITWKAMFSTYLQYPKLRGYHLDRVKAGTVTETIFNDMERVMREIEIEGSWIR